MKYLPRNLTSFKINHFVSYIIEGNQLIVIHKNQRCKTYNFKHIFEYNKSKLSHLHKVPNCIEIEFDPRIRHKYV